MLRGYNNCDMIKGNESDVADIVFEILAKRSFKLLCYILFSALIISRNFETRYPNSNPVFASKCSMCNLPEARM